MMQLNLCGKQHLSSTSVKKVYGDCEQRNFADIFTIASVMSLWQNSDAQQAPFQAPQQNKIQRGACKDALSLRQRTGTQSSSVLDANAPLYFRGQQRYRSKVTSLCSSSRRTFNLLKPTTFPDNPSEGKINETEITKDFGNDFCIIFKDDTDNIKASNFRGQMQQNCKTQTWKFGECETVQTSVKKRYNNPKNQSSSLIVLGILPLLSSVLEIQNFTQLMVSQIHVFKKLISCAIIFRLFLVREFLKRFEYLHLQDYFKVNKTFFRESNEKNLNINISSVSVVSQVLSNMALNQQEYLGWRMQEDDMLQHEEGEEEGQDDVNFREVPNFYHQESGGNGDDDEFWDERFLGEQPVQVFGRVPAPGGPIPIHQEPGQLGDGWFIETYYKIS